MSDPLALKLREFVDDHNIHPDPYFEPYKSGVHAVIDCVFSSQAKYTTVTNAIERLNERLLDRPELTFSQFLADVEEFGSERYAAEVLTRQVLAKRPKVEVSCDVARFFVKHQIETLKDFQALQPDAAEQLILVDLVNSIKGVGPVLARYLLILMGREDHVKPDTLLTRLMLEISQEKALDIERIRQVVSVVAQEKGMTPARLDNAFWKFESGKHKPLVWEKKA